MAQKRMFSLQIVDTDAFLDMPTSSQLLYFHLVMRADDEGFVGNPKKIMRLVGVQEDDLKVLIAKRFILTFDSGIIVIKHWLIHNTIRMDRFNQTTYQKEKKQLILNENKSYTDWQPNGNQMEPQVKLSKVKLSKVKLSKVNLDIGEAPQKITFKWQEEALEAVKWFKDGEHFRGRIFKCFKDTPDKARISLLDCKELSRYQTMYFFAVYNNLNKTNGKTN